MDLQLNEREAEVERLFAVFFTDQCPSTVVRASESLGHSAQLWHRLRETGAPTLALPTDHGGGGATLLEATLLIEQAGRVLAPVPLIEHLVAARAALAAHAGTLVESAVDAAHPITLALHRSFDTARLVPAGAVAERVVAFTPQGLVASNDNAPMSATPNGYGLALADRDLIDADVLLSGSAASAVFERARDEWRLLTAAALVGLADAALAMGVGYANERHQFGVPIGSFQAIQHTLADFPGPLSALRLLVRRAAWRVDNGDSSAFAAEASMAFIGATELARTVTAKVLHYHGGYGVMAEHDIQLYYRRARGWAAQLGDPAVELDHLADVLYGPAVA